MSAKCSFQTEVDDATISSTSSIVNGISHIIGRSVNYMTPERHPSQKISKSSKTSPEKDLGNQGIRVDTSAGSMPCGTSRSIKVVAEPSFIEPRKSRKLRKKRKPLPMHPMSSLSYYNEDTTCDADVDESSDSTSEKLRTTVTTISTSKTSSMSSKISSISSGTRSSGGREDRVHSTKRNMTTLITPPREFIQSSPHVEFSPLSLSDHSSCTSSISVENNSCDHTMVNECNGTFIVKQPIKKKTIPETLYFRSFRKRNRTLEEDSSHNKKVYGTKSSLILQNPKSSASSSKKPFFRIPNTAIIKCSLFIYVYCVSTFLLTSTKVNQVNFDGRANAMNVFTSTHVGKGGIRRKFTNMQSDKNVSPFQNSNQRITIKRVHGGFYTSFTSNHNVHIFKPKSRRIVQSLRGSNDTNDESNGCTEKKCSHPPRVFSFYPLKKTQKKHIVREIEMYPTIFSDNTQLYGMRDSGDPALAQMEPIVPDKDTECVSMEDWQNTHHPSCNGIHELSLRFDEVKLIGKNGFSRNAWKVDARNETVILKTPK